MVALELKKGNKCFGLQKKLKKLKKNVIGDLWGISAGFVLNYILYIKTGRDWFKYNSLSYKAINRINRVLIEISRI